jgi:hypothetical protein
VTGPEPGVASPLERRYRAVLRVLPAAYRAAWEEDMVATFLAGMHTDDPEEAEFAAEFGRPGWTEVASVLALAVRLRMPVLRARLGGPGAAPSGLLWGDAVRFVVLTGVLVNAAMSVAFFGSRLWAAGRVPWLPGPPGELAQAAAPGLWQQLWVPGGVCWMAALAALLLGYWRVARIVAALALLPEVAGVVASTADFLAGAHPSLITTWQALLIDTAVVLAMVAFHQDTPAPRRRPWLVALGVGAVVTWCAEYVTFHLDPSVALLDWSGLTSVALVPVACVELAARRGRRHGYRALALALLAAVVFLSRVVTLLDYGLSAPAADRFLPLTFGVVEAVAVLAVGLPLAVRAAREVRPPAGATVRM